jgi:hypothetical protein
MARCGSQAAGSLEGKKGIVLAKSPLTRLQTLYQVFSSGRHISNIGRFALTSFLVNVGMPLKKSSNSSKTSQISTKN